MDGRRFDELAKGLATWRTRRQVLMGTVIGAVGVLLARLGARAQSGGEAMATFAEEAKLAGATTTSTPTPTESPDAEAGASPEPEREQTTEVEQVDDNQRAEIADVCRRAAEALRKEQEDQDFVEQYRRHPHPDQALEFVAQLERLADWGASQAETWDDAMLANYVSAATATALAVQIGFDAYFELDTTASLEADNELVTTASYAQSEESREDPRTCFFKEIAKWQDCLAGKKGDTAAGQLICFWDFMVLDSCTRCMRSF